jgi:superfamily II helicase
MNKLEIKNIILKIKQKYCKHKYKCLYQEEYIGKTVDWTLKLINEYKDKYICEKCGKEEYRKYIYFGNIKEMSK